METKSVKIVNSSNNKIPAYQTLGAAGMDICAFLASEVSIKKGSFELITTGLYVEIPFGFEIQVRSRSGLAFKNGIFVLNSPGTIDSDYRGEVKVLLMNLGQEDFIVKNGDRIAQLVMNKVETIAWDVVEQLSDSDRGVGGYGSTGI
jgi:dUTP pyrophosphatase